MNFSSRDYVHFHLSVLLFYFWKAIVLRLRAYNVCAKQNKYNAVKNKNVENFDNSTKKNILSKAKLFRAIIWTM